jgi:DNA-binding LacI/PurR family transcriptional regulator
VAALAQVSTPTVSRVLNGRPGVAAATRNRVISALVELGFTDVPEPRAVRRGVIGLVCGELSNPVFPTLVDRIATHLARRGHLTTVAMTEPDLSPEERCIQEFVHTGTDGIVFLGGRQAEIGGDLDHYRDLIAAEIPFVFVNGDADLEVPLIYCDERVAAVKAVTHLLHLGHRQIGAVVGMSRYVPTARIIDGYRSTLAEAGVPQPEGAVISTAFTLEGARAGATILWQRGITGVITGNDLMALGAVQAAAALGLDVPGEVSVVGYDGTDFSGYTDPPLTTLRQPFDQMARLVADAILAEIEGSTQFRHRYVFEPELVARRSSGPGRGSTAARPAS